MHSVKREGARDTCPYTLHTHAFRARRKRFSLASSSARGQGVAVPYAQVRARARRLALCAAFTRAAAQARALLKQPPRRMTVAAFCGALAPAYLSCRTLWRDMVARTMGIEQRGRTGNAINMCGLPTGKTGDKPIHVSDFELAAFKEIPSVAF